MSKGKAYANRKSEYLRPKGDFYETPTSLVTELLKENIALGRVWECASGNDAIVRVLRRNKIDCFGSDIEKGFDFLKDNQIESFDTILTNPPFSLWDEFIMKAKEYNPKRIIMIGRVNYFGTYARNLKPSERNENQIEKYKGSERIWDHLKTVYIFNLMVDYQTLPREDGLFNVGALVTGWFEWERDYEGDPAIKILDIQKYAKLGNFKGLI